MLELYTFRISHFSEKIRWMLDAAGIEYREIAWTPFFHILPAYRHGRSGTTVPILRHRGGFVQDSTRILLWLDRNMPGFALLPRDPVQRRAVLELEDRFDHTGSHVIRFAYGALLDNAELVQRLWTLDAREWECTLLRSGFPAIQRIFRSRFGITPLRVQRSAGIIAQTLDALDAQLADGREYLVGDRLGAADITACALLAPLVGPDEHPVYGREDFRAGIAPLVEAWMQRPAFEWIRRRYRSDRRRGSADAADAAPPPQAGRMSCPPTQSASASGASGATGYSGPPA